MEGEGGREGLEEEGVEDKNEKMEERKGNKSDEETQMKMRGHRASEMTFS